MDVILFAMILTCSVALALDLFAIELAGAVSIETTNAVLNINLLLILIFTYCYRSECVTTDLLEIGDHFYNSEWYRLPVKQQRLLALPIDRAHSEFRFKGLGLFNCSLAVFSSASHTT